MGISADPVDRQDKFNRAHSLGFRLLSDPQRVIARHYGVRRRAGLPSKRATFVIGRDGKVMRVVRSETNMHVHADEALAALRDSERG